MKRLIILMVLGGCSFAAAQCIARAGEKPDEAHDSEQQQVETEVVFDSIRLNAELPRQVKLMKQFLAKNPAYDSQLGFFIDMRIPSRYYRFFAVDLKTGKIIDRGLVAHGSGSETGVQDSLVFSNTPNSYMTSLGTYKIGVAYQGSFGRSFRLHGLDGTNSKALARAVVLHRYMCVPDGEQEFPICNSLGCPMLSEGFFPAVEKYIDARKKPVLLEIYY